MNPEPHSRDGARERKAVRRHPAAWMIWAISAGGTAMLLRNPWYLALVVAVSLLVRWRASGERLHRSMAGLLFGMIAFPAIINLLFSRAGGTVLLRLPLGWLGGPYTLEALLFGLTAGVQIAALLTVMLVFGNAVRPVELLRRIPPALYPAGVAATIGMSFVTQVQKSFAGLREAQQIRGYEVRRLRDLPSITGPLLVLTLESAYGVAEGLAVRGFGNAATARRPARMMNAGFALLAMGLMVWAFAPSGLLWGAPLILGGGFLVWASQRSLGASQRYEWQLWDRGDSVIAGVCLGVLGVISMLAFLAPALLTYYPYPRVAWPEFLWPLAVAVALLSVPAWPIYDDRNPSSDLFLS